MYKLFNGVPLTKLTLLYPGEIESFPPQLRSLNLNNMDTALQPLTWIAACELRELHTIKMTAADIEVDELSPPLKFQSAQLRRVRISLNAPEEAIITQYIIQPIFKYCHTIRS